MKTRKIFLYIEVPDGISESLVCVDAPGQNATCHPVQELQVQCRPLLIIISAICPPALLTQPLSLTQPLLLTQPHPRLLLQSEAHKEPLVAVAVQLMLVRRGLPAIRNKLTRVRIIVQIYEHSVDYFKFISLQMVSLDRFEVQNTVSRRHVNF
jgi:hypothetical protein